MNKNYRSELDIRYRRQQEAIKGICQELDLVVYYPNYHADKNDKNTVLIYTQEANEYNKNLPEWADNRQYMSYVCNFENTDINGNFSLDWLNRGKIDCRGINEEEKIRNYILEKLS